MTTEWFLRVEGIPGDSTAKGHENEIDVDTFGFGLSNAAPARPTRGGGAAGRAHFDDLHVAARTSRAAPLLFLACASGRHLPTVLLTGRRAGDRPLEFLRVTLSDVIVSRVEVAGSSEAVSSTDHLTFRYSRIDVSYLSPRPDGSVASPVQAGWDLARNSAT